MRNDHIIVSPLTPDLAGTDCEARGSNKRQCPDKAGYVVKDMVSNGVGGYGDAIDTGHYCRGHVIVAVAVRL